jgi:hypothetical protein
MTESHVPISTAHAARGRGSLRRWAVAVLSLLFAAAPVLAADNLGLASGLSFTDDSSANFPIVGDHLGDADSGPGRATLLFIGTAHCWNTNREAERVVALYPRFRDRMRFVVIDVDHPSEAQRPLLDAHYHGLIPTVVVLDPRGAVIYERAGETAATRGDSRPLATLLSKAVGE